jgi:hypothetical protein
MTDEDAETPPEPPPNPPPEGSPFEVPTFEEVQRGIPPDGVEERDGDA